MKIGILTFVLALFYITGFSWSYKFNYTGSYFPKIKNESLNNINSVSDITPDFWRSMQMRYEDRRKMEELRKTDFTQVSAFNSQEYNYNNIVEYVSVNVSAINKGKVRSSQGSGNELTPQQKSILKSADPGTNISIKVNFRFKNQAKNATNGDSGVHSGELTVGIVPEVEAEYPGGIAQLSEFYNKNIFSKISEESAYNKVMLASVKFTVNEDGQITDTQISKTSTDPQLDKLILDQTKKMPKWKPAKNSEGKKIKQEITIPFGGGGC